ncbi:hypothetical protein DPMN_035964, partial [Dreissena polymorpha]
GANKPTDQQTNGTTDQQTGQKQYVPHFYKKCDGRTDGYKTISPSGETGRGLKMSWKHKLQDVQTYRLMD